MQEDLGYIREMGLFFTAAFFALAYVSMREMCVYKDRGVSIMCTCYSSFEVDFVSS